MIDKEILDAVLPLPTLDELKEQKVEELKDEGFVISNFHSGGVFYTMLMIVLRIKVEVIELLRVVLNNMFVSHAGGAWLDLKMADYSKKRKKAQKTQGFITVRRTDMTGEAVKIPKGHVFKSILDINGEELRFFVLEAATLQKGASSVDVLVEAETEGSRYNVPAGQIVRTLTYLGDVTFSNAEDWIVREGSDTEDDESARARTLRSWSELAQRATEDTFIDAAESVPGVLFAQADCNHPRGQGTVDVIVTGTAGEATEGLLAAVREAVDKIAGPYDNILVKSSVTVSLPTVWRPSAGSLFNPGFRQASHAIQGAERSCAACGRISSVKDISWPRRSWRKAAHRAAAIPSREPAHLQPPRSSITSARTPFIRASPRTLRRARRRRRVQRST